MRKSILVSFAALFAAVVAVGCKGSPKNKEYVYDVYVAGWEREDPMLWKNGEPTKLPQKDEGSVATAVFVSGNDVYVAGLECVYDGGQDQENPSRYVGAFWKNGVISRVTDLAGKADGIEINGLFVSGSDVYVVGQDKFGEEPVAMLWKNGIAETLSDGSKSAYAYSVFVSGNDIYVVGYERRGSKVAAMLWTKRGESGSWESKNLTDGSRDAYANSIYVIDNHIYIAGVEEKENSPLDIAMLWTKAPDSDTWEAKKLTNGEDMAKAYSVYAVKREK